MDESRTLLRCQGKLKDGRPCNVVLAARTAGRLYVTRNGWEMNASIREDMTIRCDRCRCITEIPPQMLLAAREETVPQ